jgi:hypothetical protein
MTICPIAIAVGCKRCPVFSVCPVKSVIGDYVKPADDKPAAKSAAAKPAAGKKSARAKRAATVAKRK